MDQFFFRIALCACLCLGGLQASPVRQCKIDRDDVMLELDNVLCVSQGAKDYIQTCLWVVWFLYLPFKAGVGKKQKNVEHPRMNFPFCLQENVTLSAPTNVTVRAPFCRSQLTSQMPQNTVGVTIRRVDFLPADQPLR